MKNFKNFVLSLSALFFSNFSNAQFTVSTFAGSGTSGFANGTGTSATFNAPNATCVDSNGNVFVVDFGNNAIRKITPAGEVTTFAGNGTVGSANGTGTAATFNSPKGIAIDAQDNIYVADTGNHLIRKITPAGVVSTFAGSTQGNLNGTSTTARFSFPNGLVVDSSGNLFVTDRGNSLIRKITSDGVVTTFAGGASLTITIDGTGTAAGFTGIWGIAIDNNGNLYVSQNTNHVIRKITPAAVVTTFVGTVGTSGSVNGTGTTAKFNGPLFLCIDNDNNIYVTELNNNSVRKITPAGVVTTFAGLNGIGSTNGSVSVAKFSGPVGITRDASGNFYVSEASVHRIRKISDSSLSISDIFLTNNIITYPNPTTNWLQLEVRNTDFANLSYQLFDLNGKMILNEKITAETSSIQMEHLPAAIFLLKVVSNNKEVKTFKIIKKEN